MLEAAADTYIVCSLSRAAQLKSFNRDRNEVTYRRRVHALDQFLPTMKGVEVRCENVFDILTEFQNAEHTLYYIDPPYIESEMQTTVHYEVNWSNAEHERLIDALLGLQYAKIVLSGYDNTIYDRLIEQGWNKLFLKTVHVASSAKGRFQDEYIWLNYSVPSTLIEQISDLQLDN